MNIERVKIYTELIELVTMMMGLAADKKASNNKTKVIGRKVQEVGLKMVIVSTDEAVRKFIRWRGIAAEETSTPDSVFNAFNELLIEMRKEFISETNINPEHIMEILT